MNKIKKVMSNGLTSTCLTIVATGNCVRLKTITIPVDYVKGYKLHPRPFCQLDPKDLFQKNSTVQESPLYSLELQKWDD